MNLEEFKEALRTYEYNGRKIPQSMHGGIFNYVKHGIKPGNFIFNILSKQFESAMLSADQDNLWLIPVYYNFFKTYLTDEMWGNSHTVLEYSKTNHFN